MLTLGHKWRFSWWFPTKNGKKTGGDWNPGGGGIPMYTKTSEFDSFNLFIDYMTTLDSLRIVEEFHEH